MAAPILPLDNTVIGPVLPPELAAKLRNSVSNESSVIEDVYGPALPPGYKKAQDDESREKQVIGPSLPIGFDPNVTEIDDTDEDDFTIGPLPPTTSDFNAFPSVSADFERRAEKMKNRLTKSEKEELKREEWMTVLPPEMSKNFGLGPRSFKRQTPRPTGDRSVWTETPSDRKDKQEDEGGVDDDEGLEPTKETVSSLAQQKYDDDMVKRIEKHNKSKRSESLLDLHQKNLKRKSKDEVPKPKERRPFDRDVDLKANVFDNAKRNALIKQSRQLNDKFSSGKGKFL